jgi:hypothetical protein
MNLHRAVAQVAHGSAQTEAARLASRPPAKAYTLHPTFKDDSDAHFGDTWLQ